MMMSTLVDSNVVIDVLHGNSRWTEASLRAIATAKSEGDLVINPLFYAEVSAAFATEQDANAAMPATLYGREHLPWEAAFLAATAFVSYQRLGGSKRSPLPDFYIGAHAAVRGYRLLTRDLQRYRAYFPTVPLIAPDTHP
jgi:predicted nucleic acid-binding protein